MVADELTRHPPGRHISLDLDDFLRSTFNNSLTAQETPDKGLILDNTCILLEPDLALNPVKLLLEFSLNALVILVWDHAILDGTHFVWNESVPDYGFNFPSHAIMESEIPDEVL